MGEEEGAGEKMVMGENTAGIFIGIVHLCQQIQFDAGSGVQRFSKFTDLGKIPGLNMAGSVQFQKCACQSETRGRGERFQRPYIKLE